MWQFHVNLNWKCNCRSTRSVACHAQDLFKVANLHKQSLIRIDWTDAKYNGTQSEGVTQEVSRSPSDPTLHELLPGGPPHLLVVHGRLDIELSCAYWRKTGYLLSLCSRARSRSTKRRTWTCWRLALPRLAPRFSCHPSVLQRQSPVILQRM